MPGKEAGSNSGLCRESCSRCFDCGKRVGNRSNDCDEPQHTGIKVAEVKDIGAKVILQGDNYDAAAQYAKKLLENLGLPLIPPYDDPDIIAGLGTVGLEIINGHGEDLDASLSRSEVGAGLQDLQLT